MKVPAVSVRHCLRVAADISGRINRLSIIHSNINSIDNNKKVPWMCQNFHIVNKSKCFQRWKATQNIFSHEILQSSKFSSFQRIYQACQKKQNYNEVTQAFRRMLSKNNELDSLVAVESNES